jgi:acyl-CoA thioesterase I
MAGGTMRSRLAVVACALASVSTMTVSIASASDASPRAVCHAPASLIRLAYPLKRTARRLAAGEPITIVAIGSSSTAGAGASSPDASYPSRLAVELKQRFPRSQIKVINRGTNGEEVHDMLARFQTSVIDEKPDLVLWQLGTNAVLRDDPLVPAGSLIHEGLRQLKAIGADVVLMDPQFTPGVIAKPEIDGMVNLLSTEAKAANVDLFPRFAVMRIWHETDGVPFDTFSIADGVHMNDWGYACVATLLGSAIAEASTRAATSAQIMSGPNMMPVAIPSTH